MYGPVAMVAAQSDPLWWSAIEDLWGYTSPVASDEVGVYLALRHGHHPVRFLVEDRLAADLGEDTQVLFLQRRHLSEDAFQAIRAWVEAGGTLVLVGELPTHDELGQPAGRDTWLGGDMQAAYCDLHREGHSHSVEVWREGKLIGGLYGVSIGRVFFGESMFSHATDASKIALYYLCEQLRQWEYELIDCQISSAHLSSLGAQEISRKAFLALLAPVVQLQGHAGRWDFNVEVPCDPAHLPTPLAW